MLNWFTESRRGYLYRILIAVGALMAGYGVISQNEVALWSGALMAVLNVTPAVNTKVGKHGDE